MMQHFIWVFTDCKCTHLWFCSIQRVKFLFIYFKWYALLKKILLKSSLDKVYTCEISWFHSHFYANFHEFLCKVHVIRATSYSFTLLISYVVFNQLKMVVQFFGTASSFPNFDGPNDIFPNSTGPWLPLQKGRKIHAYTHTQMLTHIHADLKQYAPNTRYQVHKSVVVFTY